MVFTRPELVCEVRTNWGSDVKSYERALVAATRGATNDMKVIADNLGGQILPLADEVILAECPEALETDTAASEAPSTCSPSGHCRMRMHAYS